MIMFMLAQDSGDIGKTIVGVMFLLFWVLSAVASVNKKKQREQDRVRDMLDDAVAKIPGQGRPPSEVGDPVDLRRMPQPPISRPPLNRPKRPMPQQRIPVPASTDSLSLPAKGKRTVIKLKNKKPSLGGGSPASTAPVIIPSVENRPITNVAPRATPPVQSISAHSVSKWLQPEILRREFILTEILQPPVALREQHLTH